VLVGAKAFYDIGKVEYNTITLDRRLYRMELAVQDFDGIVWNFIDIPSPPTISPTAPQKAVIPEPSHPKWPSASYIINSMVWVTAFNPLPVDGVRDSYKEGYGLVLNEQIGLVYISREVITSEFCTATIGIFGSVVIPGHVVFVHPAQNYAILKYDTSLVEAPVRPARLSEKEIQPGESALFFHCNDGWHLELSQVFVPGSHTVSVAPDIYGAQRSVSMEVLTVNALLSGGYSGSGLISEDGTVQALWSGTYCTTVASIIPVLKQLEDGHTPKIRLLGARLMSIELLDAITRGMPEGK
jgi:hypothetical protein